MRAAKFSACSSNITIPFAAVTQPGLLFRYLFQALGQWWRSKKPAGDEWGLGEKRSGFRVHGNDWIKRRVSNKRPTSNVFLLISAPIPISASHSSEYVSNVSKEAHLP